MPRERERQLLRLDAAAVIAHPDQARATALDVDLDAAGTGIEAVLDELLDDRRRTLDHLARGDLIDELTGEDADRHEVRVPFSRPEAGVREGLAR